MPGIYLGLIHHPLIAVIADHQNERHSFPRWNIVNKQQQTFIAFLATFSVGSIYVEGSGRFYSFYIFLDT